jgi:hypothetical protein
VSYNPFVWARAFLHWLRLAFCALLDPEGRRAWAVLLCGGGGMIMTAYASAALYIVRTHAMLAFWLGLAAMGIILFVMGAITALLAKRHIGGEVNVREGTGKLDLQDLGGGEDDTQAAV